MLCAINLYDNRSGPHRWMPFPLELCDKLPGVFLSKSSVLLCRRLYSTILRATVLYVTWLVHNRKLLERLRRATLGQKV